MRSTTSVVLFVVAVFYAQKVSAHGRLVDPPGRASAWRYGFDTPKDYNDNEQWCGGLSRQHKQNKGRCGVCGDPWDVPSPRPHEDGGKYATGVIVRKYYQGQTIPAAVQITANHHGTFWFRVCPIREGQEVTQECLDKHTLEIVGSGDSWKLDSSETRTFNFTLSLPADLTCDRCLLQWDWTCGNQWGVCPDGQGRLGCGPQETFRGCADIAIL